MAPTETPSLVHLAIDDSGVVLAHFMRSNDAAEYCASLSLTHLPYNLRNRDGEPAPLIGSRYVAA